MLQLRSLKLKNLLLRLRLIEQSLSLFHIELPVEAMLETGGDQGQALGKVRNARMKDTELLIALAQYVIIHGYAGFDRQPDKAQIRLGRLLGCARSLN